MWGDYMRNKIYKSVVFVFYILSFLICIVSIKKRIIANITLSTNFRLVLLFIACILIYINGLILTKKLKCSKKILKIHLIIYFLIYTISICSLTLFDELYGRQGLIIIDWDKELLNMYLKNSFNIIPFNTIKLFTEGYINDIVSFKNFSVTP